MGYKLISVKCPDCGQTLSIEENRTQAFCSYCGAKVLLSNENEYVVRQIDEAGVQKAETERLVKMRQLQMEEKEAEHRKYLVIVWLAVTIILAILGIIGLVMENGNLEFCLYLAILVGCCGGVGIFDGKKKKPKIHGPEDAVITGAMEDYDEKQYKVIAALFSAAGFRNIKTIPLHDLNFFLIGNDGKTEEVTIEGQSDFEEGDVFPKNLQVVITYHSRK